MNFLQIILDAHLGMSNVEHCGRILIFQRWPRAARKGKKI